LTLRFEMNLHARWNVARGSNGTFIRPVSFDEAVTVFGDPLGRIIEDRRHSLGEERFGVVCSW